MPLDTPRKTALFISSILFILGVMTLIPDVWMTGNATCHSCHVSQAPADHMLYRNNYLGYNSLCSLSPISTLILTGSSLIIFLTMFRVRFEKWGREYRTIAPAICLALAIVTVLPAETSYTNMFGMDTLCPAAPLSTGILLGLGVIALSGYMVCPFLIIWRCRCPVLEHGLDVQYSPHRSIVRFLKMAITGRLSEEDIKRLYRCTLCNGCWLASFNRATRVMAVGKDIVPGHLDRIRTSIELCGNPYGAAHTAATTAVPDKIDTIFFACCTSRHRTPEILESAEKLLRSVGIQYSILEDEPCCGSTVINLGDMASGRRIVDRNVEMFKARGIKRIITVCPGCYSTLSRHYKGRNGFDPDIIMAVDLLRGRKARADGKTIHDSCHAKEKSERVRAVLDGVNEEGTGGCCGAGGGLISWDDIIAGGRAGRIIAGNPEGIITYCPLCYLNLSRVDKDKVIDVYVLMASELGT